MRSYFGPSHKTSGLVLACFVRVLRKAIAAVPISGIYARKKVAGKLVGTTLLVDGCY